MVFSVRDISAAPPHKRTKPYRITRKKIITPLPGISTPPLVSPPDPSPRTAANGKTALHNYREGVNEGKKREKKKKSRDVNQRH